MRACRGKDTPCRKGTQGQTKSVSVGVSCTRTVHPGDDIDRKWSSFLAIYLPPRARRTLLTNQGGFEFSLLQHFAAGAVDSWLVSTYSNAKQTTPGRRSFALSQRSGVWDRGWIQTSIRTLSTTGHDLGSFAHIFAFNAMPPPRLCDTPCLVECKTSNRVSKTMAIFGCRYWD